DGDIAWLAALSFRCPFAQLRAELIKLALSLMTFTIDDAQPSKQGAQMEDSCLGDACGHLDGGLPQDATGGLCVKPADAMLFEQPCNGRLTQAPRLVGRRSQGPQLQKPVRADVIGEIKQVRIIAPELVADTVAKAHTFLLQFFEQTRPLAQFDHGWIADLHQPVKMSI